jgi:S1-C subfamily serine protease
VAIALGARRSVSGIRWRGALVVTAAEALAGRDEVVVVSEQGETQGSVIACDLATDVAVLRTGAQALPEAAGAGTTAAVDPMLEGGAGVVIVGRAPAGPVMGFGTVRLAGPAWRSRRGGAIAQRLEFEAVLDGRFEGALVADFAGTAQAMLVSGPRGRLLGIPGQTIHRIVTAGEQHGYLPKPYLGLQLQGLWLDEATRNRWGRRSRSLAAVAGVESESPAEAAGIAPGDLLEAIDGVMIYDAEGLAAQLAQSIPGASVALRLRRGGQSQTLQVRVGERRRPQR